MDKEWFAVSSHDYELAQGNEKNNLVKAELKLLPRFLEFKRIWIYRKDLSIQKELLYRTTNLLVMDSMSLIHKSPKLTGE